MKEPNIRIILKKKGKRTMCTGSASKAKNWFIRSLSRRPTWHQKYDVGSYIRVYYGKDNKEKIENIMDLKDYSDLRWAMKTFLDKRIWIQN